MHPRDLASALIPKLANQAFSIISILDLTKVSMQYVASDTTFFLADAICYLPWILSCATDKPSRNEAMEIFNTLRKYKKDTLREYKEK
jgi:hypothetical protein